MPSQPPAALVAAVKATADKPLPEDRLEKVRELLRQCRDGDLELAELAEKSKAVSVRLHKMKSETLPDVFAQLGIDKLGLEAEGNLPAYDADLKPFYKANISADWPPEQQDKAFAFLDKVGSGDLIKSQFSVFIGRGDRKTAKRLLRSLKRLKLDYTHTQGVPWNTLTAWLKEQVEKHNTTPPLDLLGATVGKVVALKPRKQS